MAPTRRTPEAYGLLTQRAHGAARAVARLRLERALEKAAPLMVSASIDVAATIGNEEVHDLRVALRRLRSWLRAADELLHDDIPRAQRLALRRIARRAGAARDAQVQWQWLTAPDEPFSAPAARAAQWLASERRTVYVTERERLQRRAAEKWPPLAAALAESLAAAGDPPPIPGGETLAEHLGPVLEQHLVSARRALDRIEHHTQAAAIHVARIKVKRLRYLVEAIAGQSPRAARVVRQLRALQDALGEVHDAHVFARDLAPLLEPRSRKGAHGGRPALRDLRALHAATRRRELASFRRAFDLAGSREAAFLWHDPAIVALTLLPRVTERQRAPRTSAAPPATMARATATRERAPATG
jgi:CHAD domain-containing protein